MSRYDSSVESLLRELREDTVALAEAAEHVLECTSFRDHVCQDIASAMLGHPDDQGARDSRFMADLRRRIDERLKEVAEARIAEQSTLSQRWAA